MGVVTPFVPMLRLCVLGFVDPMAVCSLARVSALYSLARTRQ